MAEDKKERKGFFSRLKEGLTKTRENIADKVDQLVHQYKELDDEFYEDLSDILIMSDVGVSATEDIIAQLKVRVKESKTGDPEQARVFLKEILTDIMRNDTQILHYPIIILVVGVNGVGKTTTIGKLALRYRDIGRSVLLCAADTFRAAAIDQLAVWSERAGVPLIRHSEGADPAAVVYDAIAAAKARKTDVLICDTAGRLHNKKNLMDELGKISRIIEREYPEAETHPLLVLDATTGQNGLNQAKVFCEVTKVSGIALTKLDGTAKGGIAVAIRRELGLPVRWICVGEGINDMQAFDPKEFVEAIF